jgi:hypothetical protein
MVIVGLWGSLADPRVFWTLGPRFESSLSHFMFFLFSVEKGKSGCMAIYGYEHHSDSIQHVLPFITIEKIVCRIKEAVQHLLNQQ